jgi:RND family efflux transporter MFP subunit
MNRWHRPNDTRNKETAVSFPPETSTTPTPRPRGRGHFLLATLAAALLAACSKPAPPTEDIRPVRAIVVSSSNIGVNAEFSGEVRARVESRLGFRVGGKIAARKVDVGDTVRRGQVLMQLDPQDLRLSQAQAAASLRAAETTRDLAKAELKRYQELRSQNFVSQAVLDEKQAALRAAQASVDAAQASFRGQSNQAGYASLVADVDGVVTGVDAEVGQVVAPGTPVVRVAKSGDKEIVIGIPEDKVDSLRRVQDVTVRTWARPELRLPGKVREVSPVADPATRTYAVKVAVPDSADVKLGMTALVRFASTTPDARMIVPLSALHQEKGVTSVWLVENGKVRLVPVKVADMAGNDVVLSAGVQPGQTVVTAGVNLLKAGQKVTILQPEAMPGGAARLAAQANNKAANVGKDGGEAAK